MIDVIFVILLICGLGAAGVIPTDVYLGRKGGILARRKEASPGALTDRKEHDRKLREAG